MPLRVAAVTGVMLSLLTPATRSFAQTSSDDAATIAALREQVAALTRRLDEVERRQAAQAATLPSAPAAKTHAPEVQDQVREAKIAAKQARAAATEAQAAQRSIQSAHATPAVEAPERIPGILRPEEMGNQYSGEDALRSDLPGVAIRIPQIDTEARIYGFAKITTWSDFDARNQTDAPTVQTIPLNGSAADQQGGDYGFTARFSRIGVDTRTLTDWGTVETRLEGDFGGGAATSNNAVFRLRQAWGEIGTEAFRVLIGQSNSLWNEGIFETLIDSTNLNQSFVRQAQIRLTTTFTKGLVGQFSIEAPETNYTSITGAVNPGSTVDGGASPAFNQAPDLLGRLTYRNDGLEIGGRALLRFLSVRTDGTAVTPSGTEDATGWGLAGHVRFPMRWISSAFGPDELMAMAYYGEGIGRYFPGNTSGLDAVTNLGLSGVTDSFSLDPVQSWGVTAAYRRFWTPQLRSNFAFSYARQDYPDYVQDFVPGSAAALSMNSEMEQGFVNLIWSPFATVNEAGVFGSGWLDLGIEYLYSRRDLEGGANAAGTAGDSHGVGNRILIGGVVRF